MREDGLIDKKEELKVALDKIEEEFGGDLSLRQKVPDNIELVRGFVLGDAERIDSLDLPKNYESTLVLFRETIQLFIKFFPADMKNIEDYVNAKLGVSKAD